MQTNYLLRGNNYSNTHDQTKHRIVFVSSIMQTLLPLIPQFVMCPDQVVGAERSEGGKRKRSESVAK
jgi:hypothetical protein